MVAGPSDPPHVPTGVAFPLGNPRACPPAPSPLLGGLRICPATAAPVAPPWGVFSLPFLRLRAFSRVSGSFCVVPSPGRAVAPVAIQCPFLLPACPPLTPAPPSPGGGASGSPGDRWRQFCVRAAGGTAAASSLRPCQLMLCSPPGRPRAPVCLGLHPLAAGGSGPRREPPPLAAPSPPHSVRGRDVPTWLHLPAPSPGLHWRPFLSVPLWLSACKPPACQRRSVGVCVRTRVRVCGRVCVCVWGGNASRLVSTSAL